MSGDPGGERRGISAIPRPLRLVLLDLDDTLCDYTSARNLRLKRAFSTEPGGGEVSVRGADLDRLVEASIAMHPHGADHFSELLAVFGVADPATAERAKAWYRANRFFGLQLFPVAEQVIAAIRAILPDPPIVGVVTNGPADVQREKAALLGVDRLVDFVIVSGEFGVEKPDAAIFTEALYRGGATPAEAVMVGDSLEHDIAGARAVGMVSVLISPAQPNIGDLDPPPDFVIRSLADLPQLLNCQAAGCRW